MSTNLTIEQLEGKLNAAAEEFNKITDQKKQAEETLDFVSRGLEQARGRYTLLKELLEEQQTVSENGTEVVSGEVVS